jgi:hypothetical protein
MLSVGRYRRPCALRHIGHGAESPHAGLGFDVTGDVLVSGEPYPGTVAYVLDELFEDAHARAVPDDMGMHGEQEQSAFTVGPIEFPPPDLPYQRRRGIRSDG